MAKLRNVLLHLGFLSSNDCDFVSSEQKTTELYGEATATGKAPGKTCKIQILGDERSGKTSLRKRLMGEQFDPEEPPTFGIDTRFCKVNNIDESWRDRKEETGNEYNHVISWYLANALRKWNNSSESSETSEFKYSWIFSKLLSAIFASASLLTIFGLVFVGLALSQYMTTLTFSYVLALFSSISLLATKRSDMYQIGTGLVIAMPLVDVLLGTLFDSEVNLVNAQSISNYIMVLWLLSGTIFGIICGCGVRIGVASGVLLVTFSTSDGALHSRWQDHTSFRDLIEILIGTLYGFAFIGYVSSIFPPMLQKVFFKYSNLSKWTSILIIFASLAIIIISVLPSLVKQFANYVISCLPGFLFGAGTMCGLLLGRWFGQNFIRSSNCDNRIYMLLTGFVLGTGFGHLSGYRIPLIHKDGLGIMNAIFRLTPLILAEMLRHEYRKNPAQSK